MTNLLDSWFKFDPGEGAFYAVFGLVFVILGISLLVLIFTVLGIIMKRVNEKKKFSKEIVAPEHPIVEGNAEEGVTPELVAAITAAIMAYYEKENVKCDFVVKRIKKV